MLGIGKIRPGREGYHLEAVADGVDDYYFAPHEAPGVWLGAGAASLGIAGAVTREQLVGLLAGRHPITDMPLAAGRAARGLTRLPGYDVSLRAPKSVSLLWALTEDDHVRAAVQAGHDAAVAGTLRHLEAVAAEARRGKHGSVRMPTTGFIAAAFRHRTSRANDPVLHTHLVIPNVVRGVDGRWSAPDGTLLYANAKSSGYVYQALLRGELSRRLGVAWGPVRRGAADLAGTSTDVIRAFSQRRVEIEARRDAIAAGVAAARPAPGRTTTTTVTAEAVARERAERVRASGVTAQLAALETRQPKQRGFDIRAAVIEWRERASALGYDEAARRAQLGAHRPLPLSDDIVAAMGSRLVGDSAAPTSRDSDDPADLCARASTWSRRDALMGWCSQLIDGAEDLAQLDVLTDTFLQHHPAVLRAEGQPALRPGDGIRLITGAFAPARGDVVRYTTRRMRAVEGNLIAAAVQRVDEGAACAQAACITAAVAAHGSDFGLPLTEAQEAMVLHVTTSGHGVDVVVGRAGSGKTTALAVAGRAWESSGHTVRGAAKAAVAARHLELATGIPCQTLDSLLVDVRNGHPPLPDGGVLVVDEAATTETPLLATLLTHAAARRWKVVLVGDDQQLAEIDAGGGFRGLRLRLGARVLSDNLRQRHPWERDAVDLVRRGCAVAAMQSYIERSRVTITDTRDAARRLMVARWWRRRDDGRPELLQAHRNSDVAELNRLVRARRVAAGEVLETAVRFGADIGVGDRVITRVAARGEGIVNGMRGAVVAVDPAAGRESVTVRFDDGGTRTLGRDYLGRARGDLPALDLAYATTIHRNQGVTAERSQTLLDRGLRGDAAYVALSRGRESNELVLVAAPAADDSDGVSHWDGETSPRRALADCLRVFERGAAKRLSLDGDEIEHSVDNAVRREQLDHLVAAWRDSLSRRTDESPTQPHRAQPQSPTTEGSPTPPHPAQPVSPTRDPHLLAIEELLAAPRADLLDAVARYRQQLNTLARDNDDETTATAPLMTALALRRRPMATGSRAHLPYDDGPDDLMPSRAASVRGPRLH